MSNQNRFRIPYAGRRNQNQAGAPPLRNQHLAQAPVVQLNQDGSRYGETVTNCKFCLLGPDTCKYDVTKPTVYKGIRHGISPREPLNYTFVRRLIAAIDKGDLGQARSEIHHGYPDNDEEVNRYSQGKLPCEYCIMGSCKPSKWKKTEDFRHFYGSYWSWSIKDAEQFIQLWHRYNPNFQPKSKTKPMIQAAKSTATPTTQAQIRPPVRNSVQPKVMAPSPALTPAASRASKDQAYEMLLKQVMMDIQVEQKNARKQKNKKKNHQKFQKSQKEATSSTDASSSSNSSSSKGTNTDKPAPTSINTSTIATTITKDKPVTKDQSTEAKAHLANKIATGVRAQAAV